MKKLFLRKPSGGGWVVTVEGKEHGCCDYEVEDHLKEYIMSVFDEEGVDEIMITVQTIEKMEIDKQESVERGTIKKRSKKWFTGGGINENK